MSTIKTRNVQIGTDATATNNFTLQIPATPDGTIKLSRGNAGATTQDVLTVDAAGIVKQTQIPYAVASWSGSIAANTAASAVPLTISFANKFTLSSNRLVIPVSGVYQITFYVGFDATSDAQISQLYVNTGAIDSQQMLAASGYSSRPRGTGIYPLSAGDLVDVRGIRGSVACNMVSAQVFIHLIG